MGNLPTTSPTTSTTLTEVPDLMTLTLAIGGAGILIVIILVFITKKRK
jgi:hypothetical protein